MVNRASTKPQRMASELESRINCWLEDISQASHDTTEAKRPLKRQKLAHQNNHLPSPSPEKLTSEPHSPRDIHMAPETPGKRKAPDEENTPRANKSTCSYASSQSGTSNRSGRSSPVKAFPVYGFQGHVLLSRTMNPNAVGMPEELSGIYQDLQDINMGYNFIPKRWEAAIKERAPVDRGLALRDFAYMSFDDTPDTDEAKMPVSLLLALVDRIVAKAEKCHNSFDETGWNHLVHTHILDAVFDQRCWPGDPMVDYSPVMTASATAKHHKFALPSTKVDYVLHITPASDIYDAIRNLQESTDEKSVNHTAFDPLRQSPICLSIETKKYGGDLKKADVQMCSWQAAQWTSLASHAGEGIKCLPFLPGIIVQGHEWKFVATTRRGDETTLWTSASMGSTMTSLGVLQIMAALSRLRRWAVEVFWPWYRAYVLKIGDVERQEVGLQDLGAVAGLV